MRPGKVAENQLGRPFGTRFVGAGGLKRRSVVGAAAWATEGVTDNTYVTYGAAAVDPTGKD